MKKACFAVACVLVGSLLLVQASSSATYDPWVDLDESGDVDSFDVMTLAGSYQMRARCRRPLRRTLVR
jgi:hypothetical protein